MHDIIAKISKSIKGTAKVIESRDMLLALVIVTSSLASFLLGKYDSNTAYKSTKEPVYTFADIKPEDKERISKASTVELEKGIYEKSITESNNTTLLFGSKSGTKYYFSWCKGASRVKMQNRVYFTSEEDAKSKGRSKAAGCN